LPSRALAGIPEVLRAQIGNVVLRVDDFPDEEVERDMELESRSICSGSIAASTCCAKSSMTRAAGRQ